MTMHDNSAWRLSRREVISLGIGAFVVSLPLVRWATRRRLIRRTIPVMGSIAEIAVLHDDEQLAQAAIEAAADRLHWVDRTMTRFGSSSDIARANLRAAREPVPVHAETAAVLLTGIQWARWSEGNFDPCLGNAVQLWNVSDRRTPPSPEETRRFAGRRLYEDLEVGRSQGRDVVRFHEKDLAVDLGGIAKGHAVDLAVAALREAGITDGLVNAGGDLYALGRAEDGGPWQAGVRSPTDPSALVTTVSITDRAIATSGDYEAYFDFGGRRYHHILDPGTGEPRRTPAHTVTVAADTCMAADAAATACFGVPLETAGRILNGRAELVHKA